MFYFPLPKVAPPLIQALASASQQPWNRRALASRKSLWTDIFHKRTCLSPEKPKSLTVKSGLEARLKSKLVVDFGNIT